MSFVVPCSIAVLVNRWRVYSIVCVNNRSDDFNYIVCNENLCFFCEKNLEKKIKGGYSMSGFILYRPQWKDKNKSPAAMNNNMNE